MIESLGRLARELLSRAGGWLPSTSIKAGDGILNYLEVGRWMRGAGHVPRRVATKEAVFAAVASEIGNRPATVLEFGVWRGDSMRTWLSLLPHPDSRFFGFDSFDGLPEFWNDAHGAGAFDLGGRVPHIDDPRVTWMQGWFSDTLPGFSPPQNDVLVIAIDADLYSSARTVLSELREHITVGTIIYFDELADRNHELKAWREFLDGDPSRFEVIAASRTLSQVAFRCVGQRAAIEAPSR